MLPNSLNICLLQGTVARKGLSAKVGLKAAGPASASADEEILKPVQQALLEDTFQKALSEELPYHQYGSPFLQAVLLASQGKE